MDPKAYQEMAETEDRHWWFVARRKILKDRLRSMKLPANARILEIGSGTGGNLEMLAQFGDVRGMEMHKEAIDMAREKTGGKYEILEGMCPDAIPDYGEPFDLICMFDVLEHVEHDSATLVKLKSLLKPGGKLLITVPAYQWLWSTHDTHLYHKRRYTVSRLRSDLKTAGWKTTYSSYFNSILFPVIALVRIKDKLIKNEDYNANEVPPKFLNRCLGLLFGFEKFILRLLPLPFGVSIIAVFNDPDHAH